MELLIPGTFPLGDERRQRQQHLGRQRKKKGRPQSRPQAGGLASLPAASGAPPARDFAALLEQGLLRIVV